MHNGVIPGSFSPNIISKIPNEADVKTDMKKQNQQKAPNPRKLKRLSFADWLRLRARSEEEENLDDNFEEDDYQDEEFDDEDTFDDEDLEDEDYEDDEDYSFDDEDDPEEFDDFDEEKELKFDDDNDKAPFPLPKNIKNDELSPIPTGRFKDFYRMRNGEEEEETDAPGGFDPGQGVGVIGGLGSNVPKIERARILMRQLVNKPNITRDDIIQQFIKRLPTTESTAVSYYEDIAREMGLNKQNNMDQETFGREDKDEDMPQPVDELPADTTQELSQEEIDAQDPDAQGIIRTVANAHLVYKRQDEDGTFEELWIYNIDNPKTEKSRVEDALSIRREILSGTDIPRGHTRSENGQQSYTLYTMGNAQLLHITGLSN